MPASPPATQALGIDGGMASVTAGDVMTPAKRSLSGDGDAEADGGFPDAQQPVPEARGAYYGGLRIGGGGAVPSFSSSGGVSDGDMAKEKIDALAQAALTAYVAPRREDEKKGLEIDDLRAQKFISLRPARIVSSGDAAKKKAAGAFQGERWVCEPREKKCRLSRSRSPEKNGGCNEMDTDTEKTSSRRPTKLVEVRDLVTDVVRGGDPNVGGVREARRACVDVLLHVMSSHPSDGPVQEYCNAELFDMVHRDPRCAPAVVGCAPLLKCIVQGMESNSENEAVQERACRTLWLLSVEDRHRAAVVFSGACNAVSKALLAHGTESETVAAAALGAIKPLSVHSKGRAALAGNAQCSTSVARAMEAHPTAAKVQAEGCSVLSNLAVDMARRKVAVLSAQEMTAVLSAMRMHPTSELVQKQACFALKNLSHQYENLARMVKCAAPATPESLLRTAIANFPEQCQRQGNIVLQRLDHFRSGPASLTSSGSIVSSSSRRKSKKKGGGSVRSGRSSRSKGSRRKKGSNNKKSSTASVCSASSAVTGTSGSSGSEDGASATIVSSSVVSAITIKSSESSGSEKGAAAVNSSSPCSGKLCTIPDSLPLGSNTCELLERPGSTSTTYSSTSACSAPAALLGNSIQRPGSASTTASAPSAIANAASNPFIAYTEASRAAQGYKNHQKHTSNLTRTPSPRVPGGVSPELSSGHVLPRIRENATAESSMGAPNKLQGDPDKLLASAVDLARRGNHPSALAVLERCLNAKVSSAGGLQTAGVPRVLNCIGYVRALSGDLPGAVTCYKRSVEIQRRFPGGGIAADREVSSTLSSLGMLQFKSGDNAKAEHALKEALEIKRNICGRSNLSPDIAPELEALGDINAMRGDTEEAERMYKFAAACYRNGGSFSTSKAYSKHDSALSAVLSKLGKISMARGDLASARSFLEIALDMKRTSSPAGGDAAAAAGDLSVALNEVGHVRVLVDDLEAAVQTYEESAELQRRSLVGTSDRADLAFADTCTTLGVLYKRLDELQLARAYFEDALDIRRVEKAKDDKNKALLPLLCNLGEVCVWVGDDEAALAYHEEALVQVGALILHEEGVMMKDGEGGSRSKGSKQLLQLHNTMSDLLVDVAGVLIRQGDVKSARDAYERALCKKMNIYGSPANILNDDISKVVIGILESLGYCCAVLGDITSAIDRYELSTKLRKRMLGANILREDFAKARSTLGVLYLKQGSLTASHENLKEALDIRRYLWNEDPTGENAGLVIQALINLGDACCLLKQFEDAESLIEEALVIQEESCVDERNSMQQIAELRKKLGHLSGLRGDLASSLEHFQVALEVTKAVTPGPEGSEEMTCTASADVIKALQQLGFVLAIKGEYDRSIKIYEESLTLLQEVLKEDGDSDGIRSTLQTLNTLHKAMECGYMLPSADDEPPQEDSLWEEQISDQDMLECVGDMPDDFMEGFEFR